MSKFHVAQIATYLKTAYPEIENPKLDEVNNDSRRLARHALSMTFGTQEEDDQFVIEVTDGGKDKGIDAIGVDTATNRVVLVQSKWRQDGSGSVDLAGVLKFVNGIQFILGMGGEQLPPCSEETKEAVRQTMIVPGASLEIVLITTASNELSEEVREPLDKILDSLNDVGSENEIATVKVLTQSSVYAGISAKEVDEISADIQLLNFGRMVDPTPAYYGRASAFDLAQLYSQFGQNLFADNIRVVLPSSEINDSIRRTILDTPENFWYFNNGITALVSGVKKSLAGAGTTEATTLALSNLTIVNGAQTVSTMGRALKDGHSDELKRAQVLIRIIEVGSNEDDLSRSITRNLNTQNVVSGQDFVYLDPEQHRLSGELRLLDCEYLIRSGEKSSGNYTRTLDVRTAAVAIACASNVANTVISKREVSKLFDDKAGPYRDLFNSKIHGQYVLRCVKAMEAVSSALEAEAKVSEGIRSGTATHGRNLIAHIVLNAIGKQELFSPEPHDLLDVNKITSAAVKILEVLVENFPEGSYPGNVFKNRTRCEALVKNVRDLPRDVWWN